MLKRKSNPWGRLRYLSILPLAAIAVAAFAHPTIARELEAISSSEFMELIPDEKQIIHEKAIAMLSPKIQFWYKLVSVPSK